jgi:hypothetical protein
MPRRAQVDIKVDPFIGRRDFEFLVGFDVVKIGTDEHLRNVPLP